MRAKQRGHVGRQISAKELLHRVQGRSPVLEKVPRREHLEQHCQAVR